MHITRRHWRILNINGKVHLLTCNITTAQKFHMFTMSCRRQHSIVLPQLTTGTDIKTTANRMYDRKEIWMKKHKRCTKPVFLKMACLLLPTNEVMLRYLETAVDNFALEQKRTVKTTDKKIIDNAAFRNVLNKSSDLQDNSRSLEICCHSLSHVSFKSRISYCYW